MSALLDRGVFPVIEAVSIEAAESVMGSAGSSPLRVPVGDQVSPVTVAGGEVGPPLTMPKFEPVSLSSGASPGDRSDWRVKISLARLQLDAQARQDDLKQQIEMYSWSCRLLKIHLNKPLIKHLLVWRVVLRSLLVHQIRVFPMFLFWLIGR